MNNALCRTELTGSLMQMLQQQLGHVKMMLPVTKVAQRIRRTVHSVHQEQLHNMFGLAAGSAETKEVQQAANSTARHVEALFSECHNNRTNAIMLDAVMTAVPRTGPTPKQTWRLFDLETAGCAPAIEPGAQQYQTDPGRHQRRRSPQVTDCTPREHTLGNEAQSLPPPGKLLPDDVLVVVTIFVQELPHNFSLKALFHIEVDISS
jgi:hypothetical protein